MTTSTLPISFTKNVACDRLPDIFDFSFPFSCYNEIQEVGYDRVAVLKAASEAQHGPLVWVATHSLGGRYIATFDGSGPVAVINDWYEGSWEGFLPTTIEEVEFTSASSGSSLYWCDGVLTYTTGTDPSYRGSYWDSFSGA